MSKYGHLRNFLAVQRGPELTMDFNEVAQLVDGIPRSALTYREWWANDPTHVQAQAWLDTGWSVSRVDFSSAVVEFSTGAVASVLDGGGDTGGKGDLYLPFWTRFLQVRVQRHQEWPGKASPTRHSWVGFPVGVTGRALGSGFATRHRLRSEFTIAMSDKVANKAAFAEMLANRDLLEEGYGRELVFEELPHAKMSRIADYRPNSDLLDMTEHDVFIDWFLDGETRFRRALKPFLSQ